MFFKNLLVTIAIVITTQVTASEYGSHSSITMHKSSYEKYRFFSQSIEGSNGECSFDRGRETETTNNWKGMILRSELGVEILRFFKPSTGFMKTDYFASGNPTSIMDRYSGFGELKIIFSAPVFNVELAAGGTASSMDVIIDNRSAKYNGSGNYFGLTFSRYLNSKMLFFVRTALNNEHYVKDSGRLSFKQIDNSDRSIGFGLSIFH